MPFKTVVAIIQGPADIDRVLACALPFAGKFGSHLIGVHAEALPMAYSSTIGFPDVEFIRAASEQAIERTRQVSAAFAKRMEAAGQSFDWHALDNFAGDSGLSGSTFARVADLVIAAQRDPASAEDDAADIDALLYEAGRPVLVVPHAGAITTSYNRVLIAWNGSREAARAVFDALPLILEAEDTEILVVDPSESAQRSGTAGADLAAALVRHGARVKVATEASDGRSVDDVVQARAAVTGADLLVMGAYSHSWLRELLFGGTTRTTLQSTQIPTFMSR